MPRARRPAAPDITPVRLSDAVADYLRALRNEGKKPHTIESRERSLKQLMEVAGGGHTMTTEVTRETMKTLLTQLAEGLTPAENMQRALKGLPPRTGRKPQSMGIDKTTLKQFIEHCQEESWMPEWVRLPKLPKPTALSGQALRNRKIIPAEDFPEILEIAGGIHPRVRMAVAAGLLWSRRISEVADAKVGDTTGAMARLRNIKRHGRIINIPIDWGMEAELDRWQKWISAEHGIPQPDWYLVPARLHVTAFNQDRQYLRAVQEDPRLWPVNPQKPTNITHLIRDIHKVLRTYGWEDTTGEGGHTLRRSGATAFQKKYGLEATQALLDHESPRTTFKYTQNVDGWDKLKEAMEGKDPFGLLTASEGSNVVQGPWGRTG